MLSGGRFPLLDQNVGQLVSLPLRPEMSAETSLQELQGSLVFGDPQQFHTSSLVWSESTDFAHDISHELVVLRYALFIHRQWDQLMMTMESIGGDYSTIQSNTYPFKTRWFGFAFIFGHFMAFV